jgi:predicted 3-demethylubiquinone-9 3-methyltransferase (glyoxalase superfamily)
MGGPSPLTESDIFGSVTDKYGIGWQVNIGTAGA